MKNFHKINTNLFRGQITSIKDIILLKKYGFTKIISLNENTPKKIDRAAGLLGVEHIIIPIKSTQISLIKFLYTNIIKLMSGGKVFINRRSKNTDTNAVYDPVDIVDAQREYPSDYADYTLGGWEQQSWSPYEDWRIKEYPYTDQYNDAEPQYHSRQDEGLDDGDFGIHSNVSMPQIGQYDQNTQGIQGSGPSMVGSGYV